MTDLDERRLTAIESSIEDVQRSLGRIEGCLVGDIEGREGVMAKVQRHDDDIAETKETIDGAKKGFFAAAIGFLGLAAERLWDRLL